MNFHINLKLYYQFLQNSMQDCHSDCIGSLTGAVRESCKIITILSLPVHEYICLLLLQILSAIFYSFHYTDFAQHFIKCIAKYFNFQLFTGVTRSKRARGNLKTEDTLFITLPCDIPPLLHTVFIRSEPRSPANTQEEQIPQVHDF